MDVTRNTLKIYFISLCGLLLKYPFFFFCEVEAFPSEVAPSLLFLVCMKKMAPRAEKPSSCPLRIEDYKNNLASPLDVLF